MSVVDFSVYDQGLVVKFSELNYDNLAKYFGWEDFDATKDGALGELTAALCEDSQNLIGDTWEEGVIIHKESYGNDLKGEFEPLCYLSHPYIDVDVSGDEWVMMCLPKYPDLYNAPYKNEESLIKQMKKLYSKFIADDNFNYKDRLVTLHGVAWG